MPEQKIDYKEFRELLKRLIYLTCEYGIDFFKFKEKRYSLKSEKDIIRVIREVGPDNFRKKCQEGFKIAQKEILKEILEIEDQIKKIESEIVGKKSNGTTKESTNQLHNLKYRRAILKEVSNVIVWTILHAERAYVRSLLIEDMGSGFLKDKNIKSLIPLVDDINKDENRFALITDITSCVGLGDIIVVDDSSKVQFIEVKEGKVNEQISDLINSKDTRNERKFRDELLLLYQKHDERGKGVIKQIMRNLKQMIRLGGAVEYMNKDEFTDPFSGVKKTALDLKTRAKDTTVILNEVLKTFYELKKEHLIIPTDCCLMGFFQRSESQSYFVNRMNFRHMIYHQLKVPWEECGYMKNEMEFLRYHEIQIYSLRDSIFIPTHKPIFLTGIKDEYIVDLLCEKIDIFTYFDGTRFQEMYEEFKVKTRWSTGKEFRRNKDKGYYHDFGGRHLYLISEHLEAPILKGPIYSIIYELQTGYSLIQQFRENLKATEKKIRNGDSTLFVN